MYCPQCASPIDGVKFCRSCGANVSLVPQALTGQLPPAGNESQGWQPGKHHRSKPPTIERAATTFFSGVGFLIASFVIISEFPGGFTWGWAFLIPAFSSIGVGVGQYLKLRELQEQRRQQQISTPSYITQSLQPPPMPGVSAPTTSELTPPSSITEDTTKHLDAARRHE
jgi:hypothetical protein